MSDKSKIRAWLYLLLAELETSLGAQGEKIESGDKVTITITFTR
jgi:hypothetical protein